MPTRIFPIIDPTRPMLALVQDFRRRLMLQEQGFCPDFALEGVLADLFFMFLRQNEERDLSLYARLVRYCSHLEALGDDEVEADDLAAAPRLTRWRVVIRDGAPVLFGAVAGHPLLGQSNRMHTSPLFRLEAGAGWARTWSRVYALESRDETAEGPAALKLH